MNRLARIAALLFVLALPGCITLPSSTEVYNQDGITVSLRGDKRIGGDFVSRGYDHPRILSALRIERVLATIEVDITVDDEAQRTSIMPYELFGPVAEGMAEAFEQASPGQEIVVMAVEKRRRLGLFHKKFLTSFLAYIKDDELAIHLSRVNWEVPKEREDKLREPRFGDTVMSFQVARIQGLRRLAKQAVAARWKDPQFGRSAAARRPSGEDGIKRRIIIMEDRLPPDELDEDLTPKQIQGLNPDQRALLERLQRQRESGEITEDEYLRARDDLLLERF